MRHGKTDLLTVLQETETIQRWLCISCGYRFSDPKLKHKKVERHILLRQVCAVRAKNLAEVETKKEAGTRETTMDDFNEIFDFLWWMKKQGYAEASIKSRGEILRRLVRLGAKLMDPESVKDCIARQTNWSEGRKANVVYAYDLFCKYKSIKWDPPAITIPEKLPFIPLEREIDDLIASCTKHVAVAL